MNADLLAMLGGAGTTSVASNRRDSEGKTILSFKAGKMNTTLQPNGKYLITPDPRRGTITLSWHSSGASSSTNNSSSSSGSNNGILKFEWTDRRTRTQVDSLSIFPVDNVTYNKIDTGRPKDRVYLLQYGSSTDQMFFYWMQDKEDGNEDEDNCVKVNMYSADPNEARNAANGGATPGDTTGTSGAAGGDGDDAAASTSTSRATTARRSGALDMSGLGGGGLDNAALMQILGGLNNSGGASNRPTASDGTSGNTENGTTATGGQGQGQVDALSNILENLGMPQPGAGAGATPTSTTAVPGTPSATSAPATSSTPTATTSATPSAPTRPASTAGKGLTLSDLQGAMATLATTSPPSSTAAQPGPPLEQIVTPETVISSGLLEDPDVKARLINFLPEDQRSEDRLMENLRSPQVVQCLKSLTGAICDEGDGGGGALGSILANFQLSPEDGAAAMAMGNPIQAFLDCVLKSVEREKQESGGGDEGNGENNDGDAEMSG